MRPVQLLRRLREAKPFGNIILNTAGNSHNRYCEKLGSCDAHGNVIEVNSETSHNTFCETNGGCGGEEMRPVQLLRRLREAKPFGNIVQNTAGDSHNTYCDQTGACGAKGDIHVINSATSHNTFCDTNGGCGGKKKRSAQFLHRLREAKPIGNIVQNTARDSYSKFCENFGACDGNIHNNVINVNAETLPNTHKKISVESTQNLRLDKPIENIIENSARNSHNRYCDSPGACDAHEIRNAANISSGNFKSSAETKISFGGKK